MTKRHDTRGCILRNGAEAPRPDGMRGEFGFLLRDIEGEHVPDRLLRLAVRLETALHARGRPS